MDNENGQPIPEPEIHHGIGFCAYDKCRHYDGKRCELIGARPGNICEPWVGDLVAAKVVESCNDPHATVVRFSMVNGEETYIKVLVPGLTNDALALAIAKNKVITAADGSGVCIVTANICSAQIVNPRKE